MLAVSLVVGSMCVPVSAQTNAKATNNANDTVDLLAEPIYDEAVTFTDSIAFLENGKWSKREWVDDEVVNSGNVTNETNIVVVDSEGNKKVIANDDGNGGKLFDAVFPMISAAYYHFDALKLMKGGQMTYLRADGSFIGGKEEYYNYAFPITEDILLVSDDKETYRVLNSAGEVTVDNIDNLNCILDNFGIVCGDLRYISCRDNCYVLDVDGNLVKEVGEPLDVISAGNGYAVVKRLNMNKSYLIDRTGKVIKTFDGMINSVSATYIEEGYIVYYKGGEGYLIENIETGEIVSKTEWSPIFNGTTIFLDNWDCEGRSLYSVDGTVYIADIDQYISDLASSEGYSSVSADTYFINNTFLISMYDCDDETKSATYVFTEESGYNKES